MSTTDVFTLIIAAYGAVVATILGIRELQRDKRRISVTIEDVRWEGRGRITITNVGYRPITIAEIKVEVNTKQNGESRWERVPRGVLFALNPEEQPFPATLEDGQYLTLPLSDVLFRIFFPMDGSVIRQRVFVYDVEGHIYTKFKLRVYDQKWGGYERS